MYIVKVLKRKDAASVVIAIILAMIIGGSLQSAGYDLAARLTNENQYIQDVWKMMYLVPVLSAVIQLLLVELGLRIFIPLRSMVVRRK
jgi:hypothetical protein